MRVTATYKKPGIWSRLGTLLEGIGGKLHGYQVERDYRRYARQNRHTARKLERLGVL